MPRLAGPEFIKKLAAGNPIPALLLLGGDRYLRGSLRSALVEKFVPPSARNWGVIRESCRETSLDKILQQAQMLPMLCPHQLIFISDMEALQRLGEESREAAAHFPTQAQHHFRPQRSL